MREILFTYLQSVAYMEVNHGKLVKEKLLALQTQDYRRMIKISGIEIQNNEDELRKAGENRNFLKQLKIIKAQLSGQKR